eukprot:1004746-Rhodomonas_salina.4
MSGADGEYVSTRYGMSVYMKANQHYKTAVSTAGPLLLRIRPHIHHQICDARITRWLQGGSTASPEHPRRKDGGKQYRIPGPGMPVKNFKWTYPKGVQPPKSLKEKRQIQKQRAGDFLRLPVGVATALMQQRLSQEQKLGSISAGRCIRSAFGPDMGHAAVRRAVRSQQRRAQVVAPQGGMERADTLALFMPSETLRLKNCGKC